MRVLSPGVTAGDSVGAGRPQLGELPLGIASDLIERVQQSLADLVHVGGHIVRAEGLGDRGLCVFASGRESRGNAVEMRNEQNNIPGTKLSVDTHDLLL